MSIEFLILELIIIMIFFGSIKAKILTIGGAFAAFIVGTIISLCGFEYFIILAGFFFSSSKATNIHIQIKTKLLGKSYLKDKKRNAIQVFSKSLFPSIICLIIYKYFGKGMHLFTLENIPNYKYKIVLDSLFIGFFESANADTWASELGISSNNLPVLILQGFKKVPKGINGAISCYGTICSILGGLFISFIVILCNIFRYGIYIFITMNLKQFLLIIKILIKGGIIGFLGSLIDSLLGQTLQLSIYNETKKCVIEKENELESKRNGDKLKYYGRDILNNSGVNLVTGLVSSLISGYISTKII